LPPAFDQNCSKTNCFSLKLARRTVQTRQLEKKAPHIGVLLEGDENTGRKINRRQRVNADMAIPRFIVVVGEQNVPFDFGAEAGRVLELALREHLFAALRQTTLTTFWVVLPA
jgi:hypothetical protein